MFDKSVKVVPSPRGEYLMAESSSREDIERWLLDNELRNGEENRSVRDFHLIGFNLVKNGDHVGFWQFGQLGAIAFVQRNAVRWESL